ncbi:uncharacterized protein ACB057_001487 [Neosynchiropus ocellatus]
MAALLCLALLLACFAITSGSQRDCQRYVQIGSTLLVPLQHKLQPSESLVWKHNSKRIFHRKMTILTGAKDDVTANGSLLLKNIEKKHAGDYSAEVFNSNGQVVAEIKSPSLCVLDPVSKPTVKADCGSSLVTFTCQTTEKNIAWLQNDQVLAHQSNLNLTLTVKESTEGAISCRVSNQVSESTSDQHTPPDCQQDGNGNSDSERKLLGLEFWTMIIILSAGGGFVLLLIIILVVCCVCASRKRTMRVKDEAEFRLTWANAEQQKKQNKSGPVGQHHPRSHPHKSHHQPAGNTGPRSHCSKKKKDQQNTNKGPQANPRRQMQGPRQPSDEQAPPLPKPRGQGKKSLIA